MCLLQDRCDCVREDVEEHGAVTGRSAADLGCCRGVLKWKLHGAHHDVHLSYSKFCQVHAVQYWEPHGWGHDVDVG